MLWWSETLAKILDPFLVVLNALPNDNKVNAKMILEINEKHPISEKIKTLYNNYE